jgi:glycosyltransferase involved in cell wall biosynthesis
MKIAIVNVELPGNIGGAELLVRELSHNLQKAGHWAELKIFHANLNSLDSIVDSINFFRNMNLDDFDIVVAVKFPCYFIQHSNKKVWLLHQFRPLNDLFGRQYGFPVTENSYNFRKKIVELEIASLSSSRANIRSNSEITSHRLRKSTGISTEILLAPLTDKGKNTTRPIEINSISSAPLVIALGRLSRIKRQDLVIKAHKHTSTKSTLVVAGTPEDSSFCEELLDLARKRSDVVVITRHLSDEEMLYLYRNAIVSVYIPYAEDSYGYVIGESLENGCFPITTSDSGGCAEFLSKIGGKIASPNEKDLARAIEDVLTNYCSSMVDFGKPFENWKSIKPSWSKVIDWIVRDK